VSKESSFTTEGTLVKQGNIYLWPRRGCWTENRRNS